MGKSCAKTLAFANTNSNKGGHSNAKLLLKATRFSRTRDFRKFVNLFIALKEMKLIFKLLVFVSLFFT